MSFELWPTELALIPEETARVARAAFPKGTLFMRMRDELGAIYHDAQFAALYPPAAASRPRHRGAWRWS